MAMPFTSTRPAGVAATDIELPANLRKVGGHSINRLAGLWVLKQAMRVRGHRSRHG